MRELVYKDNKLIGVFSTHIGEALSELIYLASINKGYRVYYRPNYTDKMRIVISYQNYKYEFIDIPCNMNHIDFWRLFAL